MSERLIGKIIFVNHEKQYVTVEFTPEGKGKSKTVNGLMDKETQAKWIENGLVKKQHNFSVNDVVHFELVLSPRGDKQVAANIVYKHNEALDVLLNKAKTKNEFNGYIKIVENKFYVKEIDSYRFFPLSISPWQQEFTAKELTEAQPFMIENMERKEKATAVLLYNKYIPEYHTATKLFKAQTPITAKVVKVTDFGVYLNIVGDKIQAKIADDGVLRLNQELEVKISFLSPTKIAVERV